MASAGADRQALIDGESKLRERGKVRNREQRAAEAKQKPDEQDEKTRKHAGKVAATKSDKSRSDFGLQVRNFSAPIVTRPTPEYVSM